MHRVMYMPQLSLVLIVTKHEGMAGLVDPGGWLHTKVVCLPKDGHLS